MDTSSGAYELNHENRFRIIYILKLSYFSVKDVTFLSAYNGSPIKQRSNSSFTVCTEFWSIKVEITWSFREVQYV